MVTYIAKFFSRYLLFSGSEAAIFKTGFYLFLISIFFINGVHAQGPLRPIWDFRYGGDNADGTTCFILTQDRGFMMAGYSVSGATGDKSQPSWGGYDYWIVKTDTSGAKQFDLRFGGTSSDLLTAIQQTKDGGFIFGGYSESGIGGDKSEISRGIFDFWIVKTDSAGNKMWDKCFGGDDYDEMFSVLQTSDGGFLLGGWSLSGATGDKTDTSNGMSDYWVVRTDSLGNKMWDRSYGGSMTDNLTGMAALPDGGFILCGTSASDSSGDKTENSRGSNDYWLVKIDSAGNKIWDKTLGGSGVDVPSGIQSVYGGNFVVGGWSDSPIDGDKSEDTKGFQDFWIVKIDTAGNKLWDRDFGGSDIEDGFGNIFQTNDSGLMITGTTYSNVSGDKTENNLGVEQCWLIKTDSLGMKEWDQTIFTTGHDETGFVIQSPDGCYEVTVPTSAGIGGYKTQDSRGFNDYWIIKFCDSTLWPLSGFVSMDVQICPGSCTNFTNLSYNSINYQWSFPGGMPSSSTDSMPPTICYTNPGNYDVVLITGNYFSADTLILPDYITVFPLTMAQSITQGNDTLYSLQGFVTYQWYFNGSILNGATDYFYVAAIDGDYSVVCADSNGCELEAVLNDVHTEVLNMEFENRVEVFPNPASEKIKIRVINNQLNNRGSEPCQYSIYNMTREEVVPAIYILTDHSSNYQEATIDVRDLSEGIYVIQIWDGTRILRARFVIASNTY